MNMISPTTSRAQRNLDVIRAIAAAHACGNATNVTEMRRALQRILAIADGDVQP